MTGGGVRAKGISFVVDAGFDRPRADGPTQWPNSEAQQCTT